MAEDAGSIFAEVRLRLDKLEVDIKKAQSSIDEFGKKIDQTTAESAKKSKTNFDAMGLAATIGSAAIVAAFRSAIKGFVDYDSALTDVRAATRATASELSELEQAAKDAGKTTAFSAKEALKGIEALSKAGVSNADIMGGALTGALSLAAAGSLEVGVAAETAAAAMTQFGLSGQDASHVADLLAAAAGKSQGEVSDYAQALNQVGLVAAQTGLSIEETTAALAAFGAAGLKGSDAGTSFKTMLLALNGSSAEAKALMQELGISAFDASGQFVGLEKFAGRLQDALKDMSAQQRNTTLQTIFGTDAIRAANVLYKQGAKGISEWAGKVNDAGFAAETARIKNESLEGHFKKLSSAAENASNSIVEKLSPTLKGLADSGTAVLNFIAGLPAPIQAAVAGFLVLGGAFVAATLAARGLGIAISGALGPIGIAVAAIGAIAGGIAQASSEAREFERQRLNGMFNDISDQADKSGKSIEDFTSDLAFADRQLQNFRSKGLQLTGKDFEWLAQQSKLTNDQLAQLILRSGEATLAERKLAEKYIDSQKQAERLLALRVLQGQEQEASKRAELDALNAAKERARIQIEQASALTKAIAYQNDLVARGVITEEEGLNNKIKLRQDEIDKIIEAGEKSGKLTNSQISEIKRLQSLNEENAARVIEIQNEIAAAIEASKGKSQEYFDELAAGYLESADAALEYLNGLDEQAAAEDKRQADLDALADSYLASADAAIESLDQIESHQFESFRNQFDTAKNYISQIQGLFQGLISALAELYAVDNENKLAAIEEQQSAALESIDAQLQAQLEAAGVADLSKEQQAQKEVDDLKAQLAAETDENKKAALREQIIEAEKAVTKAKIEQDYADKVAATNKEFEKKKAQQVYEGELAAWGFKLAGAIAQVPVAVINAMSAGYAAGFPAGLVLGPAMGIAAGIAGGIQIAAIAASKPKPPQLQTGGIVLPQAGGVPVVAAENGSPELMLNGGVSGQALLGQFADMIGDRLGAGGNIVLQLVVDGRMIAETTAPYFEKGIVRLKL